MKLTQVNITSLNKSLNNKYFIDISAKTKRRNKHGDVNYVSHMLIGLYVELFIYSETPTPLVYISVSFFTGLNSISVCSLCEPIIKVFTLYENNSPGFV